MNGVTTLAARVLLACLGLSPAFGSTDNDGWQPLFTEDLSNADAPPGVWRWDNGTLTATEDQCIWTKQEFENFELELEFRLGESANSGVVLYCTDPANWIPNSIEVQLLDESAPKWTQAPPTWRCGAIFGHLAPTNPAGCRPNEWHHLRIVARGPVVTVAIDGRLTTRLDMRQWTSPDRNPDGSEIPPWLRRPLASLATRGRIGLQGRHAGAPVWFRHLRVRPARD